VFYEVFVRSFRDSDGDGVGDLRGLIEKLDYINDGAPGGDDIEANAIWLMPIFESPSYHGYDVVDYRSIDAEYGSMADFRDLVAACEARGVRLVLDFVMNHTSSAHPWFVESAGSAAATRRSWYVWRDDNPGWGQPFGAGADVWHLKSNAYYYGIFWEGMPDLNYRTPAVLEEMASAGELWLKEGAAGFRVDAARYLVESASGQLAEQPETHAVFREFRKRMDAARPGGAYLVAEAWTTRANMVTYYGDGAEFPQAFDFDLQLALERAAKKGQAALLRSELGLQKASGAPWKYSATFVGNHDIDRLSFRLNDTQQRAVAVLLFTLPGTPYVYYGDEYGMRMALVSGDQAKRAPMAWNADPKAGFTEGTPWSPLAPQHATHNVESQLGEPGSLLNLYRELVRLRRAEPALRSELVLPIETGSDAVFAMLRPYEGGAFLVLTNLGPEVVALDAVNLSEYGSVLGLGPFRATVRFGGGSTEAPFDALGAVPTGGPLSPGGSRVLKIDAAGR
jgi:glycosidase